MPGCFKMGKQVVVIHRTEFALLPPATWKTGVKVFFFKILLLYSLSHSKYVKFNSVPVPTVTRVKLALLLALLGFHFSTSLSKINHVPLVFKFHYHDLT